MKISFLLAASAALLAACATAPVDPTSAAARRDQAQTLAAAWHPYSQAQAARLMDEYGAPDVIGSDRLVWYNQGPWSKIAVWDAEDYRRPGVRAEPEDDVEQTLSYEVPAAKLQALKDFSDKLAVSLDGRQLAFRGPSEELNFLAANLADEIVRGKRSPEDARGDYDRICRLSQAGKSSVYTQGLLFKVDRPMLPRATKERSDILNMPINIWEY
jgi:hypothetical protein